MSGYVKVGDLKEGDMVDLDPDDPVLCLCAEGTCLECDSTRVNLEYEYQVVDSLEFETSDCTVVHFENHSFGFPNDRQFEIMGNSNVLLDTKGKAGYTDRMTNTEESNV